MLSKTEPNQNQMKLQPLTHLRTLNQSNKTLSTYIQEVRRVVDLYNFACVGDCKDRLIRNSIVAGLSSTKAYQQCISKGSSPTLNACIRICQTEDATCTDKYKLFDQSLQTAQIVHQYTSTPDNPISTSTPQVKFQGQRRLQRPTQSWEIQPQGWYVRNPCPQRDYRHSTETTCRYCGSWPHRTERRMQSLRPRVLQLWETWAFFKSMQTKLRLSQ